MSKINTDPVIKKDQVKQDFEPELEVKLPPELKSVAYSLVEEDGVFKICKFNFDKETMTMSQVEEVSVNHSKYDGGDELMLLLEDEIYS
jgi:hypothetical protein